MAEVSQLVVDVALGCTHLGVGEWPQSLVDDWVDLVGCETGTANERATPRTIDLERDPCADHW